MFCPTFKDIGHAISHSNVKQKPSIEYIQCGTTDIEKVNFNLESMGTRLGSIINELNRVILAEDGDIIVCLVYTLEDRPYGQGQRNE